MHRDVVRVRNPDSVLDGGWRRFVHLKVFVRRMIRRNRRPEMRIGKTPDADSTRGFVNSGVSDDSRSRQRRFCF